METDPFAAFISEIIETKQLSGLDADVRKQLESDLQTSLLDQIDRAVVDNLPEDKIDGLNALFDSGASEDEVQRYIANSGINIKRITLETMLRFRELYLGENSR